MQETKLPEKREPFYPESFDTGLTVSPGAGDEVSDKRSSNTEDIPENDGNINRDFNRFFREEWELRRQNEKEAKKKKIFIAAVFVVLCVLTILTYRIISARVREDKNVETTQSNIRDAFWDESQIIIRSANPDYTYSRLENIRYSHDKAHVNTVLISHIEDDFRTVYFRVKTKMENVTVLLTVSVYDRAGNKLGEYTGHDNDLKTWQAGIIPITMPIGKDEEVTYSVKCTCGTLLTTEAQRELTDVREENGRITVTVRSDFLLNKDVTIIFYKDNALVDMASKCTKTRNGAGGFDIEFEVDSIDYDTFEVYL